MSKFDKSLVKYPKKSEIQNQINSIIEQSHMFETQDSKDGYVECKRVRRSFFASDAATVAIALAACVILIICIAPFWGDATRNSEAHGIDGETTEQNLDDSMENSTRPQDQNMLTDTDNSKKEEISIIKKVSGAKSSVGQLFPVVYIYANPVVAMNGEMENSITNFYTSQIETDWKQIETNFITSQLTDKDRFKNVTSITIDSSVSIDGCVGDFYSLTTKYVITTATTAEHNLRKSIKNYYVSNTFEASNGTYANITRGVYIKDYESKIDKIAKVIYDRTKEKIEQGTTGIQEGYMSLDEIKKMFYNNDITIAPKANGILVYCNGYREYKEAVTEATVLDAEQFLITEDKYNY